MKRYILWLLLIYSLNSFAQADYKKQLDSLLIVHKVCVLENTIQEHRSKMQQLKNERQELNAALAKIKKFRLFRSEVEKKEQLGAINGLIETNAIASTTATVYLTSLINELVLANEEVEALQSRSEK